MSEASVACDRPAASPGPWCAAGLLLGGLLWSYWPTLVDLFKEWQINDNYSVGQLVPLAALYLLWGDRKKLAACPVRRCWWGILLILAAQGARVFGLVRLFESAERYSFVLTIAGVVLLAAGWRVFQQVKWILLFLLLMIPLPGRIHNSTSGRLQSYAADSTVFVLELLGMTVSQDGNVLVLNDEVQIAVAEACSGLRMLTAFVVVAATLAYVIDRPKWQKALLVASGIPIAMLCNVVRLTATAFLFLYTSEELAKRFFHDFAGLSMMPIAVLLLVAELWIISKLVIADDDAGPK